MVNLQLLILRDHQHHIDHLLLPNTLSSFGSADTTLHILLVFLLPQWTILTRYISLLPWPLNVRIPSSQSPSLHICPASGASLPPDPIPPLEFITEHPAELPLLNSSFPLAVYLTYGSIYISMLLSQFIPLLLPPLCPQVSKSPFSKSAIYFCSANGLINTISRFHIQCVNIQ